MRNVVNNPKPVNLKEIEVTHLKVDDYWLPYTTIADPVDKIVYLGKQEGSDLFEVHHPDHISLYKGVLNDGIY